MKKFVTIASLSFLLFYCVVLFFSWNSSKAALFFLDTIREELKYRVGEGLPDMTDAYYDSCIKMAANAVLAHGLALYTENSNLNILPNTKHLKLIIGGSCFPVLIFTGVTKRPTVSTDRGIPSIGIKDIGHKSLDVSTPHSFHFFYYDQDTPYVFIYPSSPDTENVVISWYRDYITTADLNAIYNFVPAVYNEPLINYAAMLVWLRLKNFARAAEAYNNYQREVSRLRQEQVNWQPDRGIERTILE